MRRARFAECCARLAEEPAALAGNECAPAAACGQEFPSACGRLQPSRSGTVLKWRGRQAGRHACTGAASKAGPLACLSPAWHAATCAEQCVRALLLAAASLAAAGYTFCATRWPGLSRLLWSGRRSRPCGRKRCCSQAHAGRALELWTGREATAVDRSFCKCVRWRGRQWWRWLHGGSWISGAAVLSALSCGVQRSMWQQHLPAASSSCAGGAGSLSSDVRGIECCDRVCPSSVHSKQDA